MRYRLVSFDFDHTLTLGATAAEHMARFVGAEAAVAAAEAAFRAGRMTTDQFTDATADLLAGHDVAAVETHMRTIPLIGGVADLVAWLHARGLRVIVNTVGYADLVAPVAAALGFDGVSGAGLERDGDRFTGRVTRYFRLEDKIAFAEHHAARAGGDLSTVIAVGDGLSDVPLFAAVGGSIAFNADERTAAAATCATSGTDCTALRAVLAQWTSRRRRGGAIEESMT